MNKSVLYGCSSINELKKQLKIYEGIKKSAVSSRANKNDGYQVNRTGNNSNNRCFNCSEQGHIASACTKLRREKGSCFTCGKMDHTYRKCPSKLRRAPVSPALPPSATTLLVQPCTNPSTPYKIRYNLNLINDSVSSNLVVDVLVDSGSPISLIRVGVVPTIFLDSELAPSTDRYAGLNNSALSILGSISTIIEVDKFKVPIKLFVVPDSTMSFSSLLGRDFISSPGLEIILGSGIKIREKEYCLEEIGIMNIEYIDQDKDKSETDLNIGASVNGPTKDLVGEIFNDFYLNPTEQLLIPYAYEVEVLLTNNIPFHYNPRRLSYFEKTKLREIIDDLLKNEIIKPSASPYASPIVLVKKKSGELRLCVDFRDLNKITVRDHYPIPLIDDHLDRLRDKKYFTVLDLKSGFHHIPVASDSTKYFSFVTPLGQFEYCKLPFGWCNSPSKFQRYLNCIFKELIDKNEVLILFDDYCIATESIEDNLLILKKVLILMASNKLELRLDKCFFLQREVTYLGYLVNEEGIRPNPENVKAVAEFPLPKNIREVQRFFGLTSYFRRFIKDFAVTVKPLSDMLRKGASFQFGAAELQAFELLRDKLTQMPLLAIYSPELETQLHCDASSVGYGAILLQVQSDGLFHPVFYYSKRTTDAESRYHSFELECLCIVNALKRFRVYLQGIKFKIITDCNSVKLTLAKKDINPRIARWSLFLQDFDYELEHRSSNRMRHVDALSRCINILVLEENTFEQNLSVSQMSDPVISRLKNELECAELPYFELRNGLVYRKESGKILFYVPKVMETRVITSCHDDIGHVGVEKSLAYLKTTYWFPKARKKIKAHIQNCLKCLVFSPQYGRQEGFLNSIPKGNVPFGMCHVDHVGPFEKSFKNRNLYILVVVDGFTKFVKLYPCKSTKTEEVIKHLSSYFANYSRPRVLVSDRGSCFTSANFKAFMDEGNIKHVLVATEAPWANGQVERMNRTIVPMLAKISPASNRWDDVLDKVEFALNNTLSKSTGATPARLLFGVDQNGVVNDLLRSQLIEMQSPGRELTEIREKATENIKESQSVNKKYYDKKRKKGKEHKVGDYVLLKNTVTTAGTSRKLMPRFKGPYEIKKILPNDRFVIKDIEGFQVTQVPYEGVAELNHMRPWVSADADTDSDTSQCTDDLLDN